MSRTMSCIPSRGLTTPEKTMSNPWHGKGFCEPQQYKSAIDRSEGGYKSLELGVEMYESLFKLFESHSAAIRKWSQESQKQIHESKEFGTTKKAWLSSVRAVEKLAERNDDIAAGIQKNVINEMTTYRDQNYGKSFIHVKKIKEFEKEFKKVQKSWLECLEKITEAKQAYHESKRKLHQAKGAADVIQSDVGASDENVKKARTSVEHRTKETNTLKEKYQRLIQDVQSKQDDYQKDMFRILARTDDFEKKRLEHFNSIFHALQQATLVENEKYHTAMREAFSKAITEHDATADIEYFNQNYGSKTKCKWPVFEDIQE